MLKKLLVAFFFVTFTGLIYYNIKASSNGIVGWTKKTPFEPGCLCHGLDPSDSTTVFIDGPSKVSADSSAVFRLFIIKNNLQGTGWNVAAGSGQMDLLPGDTVSKILPFNYPNRPDTSFELTHAHPLVATSDTAVIEFVYQAPNTGNLTDTIFANGNAVNLDGTGEDDKWNFAPFFMVDVTPVSVTDPSVIISDFKLNQNYPNPFNPVTRISFSILKVSDVSLEVFDLNGKRIAVLFENRQYQQGEHSMTFDAGSYGLSSGIYFYKLSASTGQSDVKKMVLFR